MLHDDGGRYPCLQLVEKRVVYIEPPTEWATQPDYEPGKVWLAKTKWYGERNVGQHLQEWMTKFLFELGARQSVRGPTKF